LYNYIDYLECCITIYDSLFAKQCYDKWFLKACEVDGIPYYNATGTDTVSFEGWARSMVWGDVEIQGLPSDGRGIFHAASFVLVLILQIDTYIIPHGTGTSKSGRSHIQ